MEEQLREKIISLYRFDILEMENFQHLWKLKTNNGVFMLKAYHKRYHHLDWIHFLNHQLQKKGFDRFPYLVQTREGNPFFTWQGAFYVVMPMLKGRNARYIDLNDINTVIVTLANFHHHAAYLPNTVKPSTRKIIYQKYTDRLTRFIQLYNRLPYKNNPSELDKYILLLGKEMIRFGSYALEKTDTSAIDRLQQQAIDHAIVCHRDVASHNFLIDQSKGWIIDFDLTGYEPHAVDFLQLTQRIMVEWRWDIDLFYQIEKTYLSFHPLQEAEKIAIHRLSLFPNEFFREVLGVYERPEKFKVSYVTRLLEKYYFQFERFQRFQKEMTKL